ncbi:proline dehydrogenase/delta-1-pyrroline-5-carboxylate dehydrogenase [Wolbachia endosymbiont of Drosophila ananassae]|nr:proline dehydrogenase/delta-1-pyrroline-5-carboxylate dehydrogenase [Wolbachia endosymbiont of Drosophila ananassae]
MAIGNAVLAKPAEQTPIIAYEAVKILHEAGIPKNVLHLIPGDGGYLGKILVPDNRIAGVAFTGSTQTAQIINKMLANRDGPIVPLIAETGGLNAMIVDSSAILGYGYENMVTKQDDGSLLVSCQCVTLESRKKESWIPVSATQMTNGKFFNGAVVEICSVGVEILKKLEKKIYNNKGAALIVDYGYVYPAYKSTLQSIKQHKYANFLENVGNSDITALVNFQALRDSLKHVDCEILTQREFLYLFGIKERTQALMKSASDEQKNRIFSEFLRLTENMGTLFKAMLLI